MISLLLLILSITVGSHAFEHEHFCNHGESDQEPEFYNIEEDMSSLQPGRVLVDAPLQNIRIYPYYDLLKMSSPNSYVSYIIDELVPPAVDYFQAALKVRYPVVGNLSINTHVNSLCNYRTPPLLHVGVDADLFIFYDSEEKVDNLIASSKYCLLATGSQRPIVGRTILNRRLVPVADGNILQHEKNMYVIMHEMIHIFGFSSNSYRLYIDLSGKQRTGHVRTTKIAGITRTILDIPPLTDKLRNFYGCSTLEGAILENGGGIGTGSSHFERRFFVYEAMSSGSIPGRRISEFTLALLEGTGWYVPDYSFAEPFFYGQGQGCSFMNEMCSETDPQFPEFCAGSDRGCAPHGRSGGSCSGDANMEGCRYYYPNEAYDCDNGDGTFNARLPGIEAYGRGIGSKCFTGDLSAKISVRGRTSFCFNYSCSGSGLSTIVEVKIGSRKVTCTKAEKRTLDGFFGSIDCPDPLTFCNTIGKEYCPRNCMGRGTCVNNQCQCNSGFKGVDCALND